jgi:ABC-2 type transport system ATP-binding protein
LLAISGVKRVEGKPLAASRDAPFASREAARGLPSFELIVEDIGPVLARVAAGCAACGAELVSATTTEPTLERVFLHLTGRGLRD